jgi:hypothetical protein
VQIEELALAQSGPGEELDREPGERVGVLAGGAQQLRCGGVIDEPWQRLVTAWDVAGEHQHARRSVVAVSFGETLEAHSECSEVLGQSDVREPRAAERWPPGEVALVALDVNAAEINDRCDLERVCGQPAGELAQDRLDANHRRGS